MLLSLVIPVYNEEDALPKLFAALEPVLSRIQYDHELIFVDDGSRDRTRDILLERSALNPRVKLIRFSRNFGHQAAITAGLDFANGDAVIVMDADLQDPPDLIPILLARFEEQFDVVSAQRANRESDAWFKRTSAGAFYRLMKQAVDPRLPAEVGDFRLFSRAAVEAIRGFREQHRFMRGLIAWLGLREAFVPFTRAPRAAGETKYPLHKMVRFAWTAITSFSALPLKLSLYVGVLLSLSGFGYGAFVVVETFAFRTTVRGWSSLVCLELVFHGATLTAVGLVGDYVARIYEECKGRPLYVVDDTRNLSRFTPPRAVCLDHPFGPSATNDAATISKILLEHAATGANL